MPTRSDTSESLGLEKSLQVGQIILATNLAGRGANPRTTEELEQHGGLHVCLSFLPDNQRVQDQAFGRTSRQGKFGTAQLIIDKENTLKKWKRYFNPLPEVSSMEELKALRDKIEFMNINYIKDFSAKRVQLQDTLFSRFCALKSSLMAINDSQFKFLEVEWRYCIFIEKWMDKIDKDKKIPTDVVLAEFETFSKAYLQSYKDVDIADPCLLGLDGLDSIDPIAAIAKYTKAIEMDPVVSMQSYFNRAFSKIAARVPNYKESARADLLKAKEIIEQHYVPYLQARMVILNLSPDAASAGHSGLIKQIEAKINFYQHQVHHILQIIKVIEQSKFDLNVKAGGKSIEETLNEFKLTKTQQTELYLSGMCNLFEVEEEPEEDDGLLGIFTVAVFGIVQIVAGVLISTVMPATGSVLIEEGIGDLMFAARSALDGRFSWDAYLATKTTSMAVSVITLGVNTIRANLPTTHPLALQTAAMPAREALKGQVIQAVTKAGIKEAINFGVDKLSKAALKQFEKDIKDSVSKTVNDHLNRPEILSNLNKLLAADKNNANFYYLQQLKQLSSQLIHTKQGQNKISTLIFKGVLAKQHAGLGTVLRLSDMGQALSEVLSFTEDFCEDFAKGVKIYGGTLPTSPEDYPALRGQLCALISKKVSKSLIKYLHTGVVSPATNMVMSEHVDKMAAKIQETCLPFTMPQPKPEKDVQVKKVEEPKASTNASPSDNKKELPKKTASLSTKTSPKIHEDDFYDLPDLVETLNDKSPQKVFNSIDKAKGQASILPLFLRKTPKASGTFYQVADKPMNDVFENGLKNTMSDTYTNSLSKYWKNSTTQFFFNADGGEASFPVNKPTAITTDLIYKIDTSRPTVEVIDGLAKHLYTSKPLSANRFLYVDEPSINRFIFLASSKENIVPQGIKATEIAGAWPVDMWQDGGRFFCQKHNEFIPNPNYKSPASNHSLWKTAKIGGLAVGAVGGLALTTYAAIRDYNIWMQTYQQDTGDFNSTHRESARIAGAWTASVAYSAHWASLGGKLAGGLVKMVPKILPGPLKLIGGLAGGFFGYVGGGELSTAYYDACQPKATDGSAAFTPMEHDISAEAAPSPGQRLSFFQQYGHSFETAADSGIKTLADKLFEPKLQSSFQNNSTGEPKVSASNTEHHNDLLEKTGDATKGGEILAELGKSKVAHLAHKVLHPVGVFIEGLETVQNFKENLEKHPPGPSAAGAMAALFTKGAMDAIALAECKLASKVPLTGAGVALGLAATADAVKNLNKRSELAHAVNKAVANYGDGVTLNYSQMGSEEPGVWVPNEAAALAVPKPCEVAATSQKSSQQSTYQNVMNLLEQKTEPSVLPDPIQCKPLADKVFESNLNQTDTQNQHKPTTPKAFFDGANAGNLNPSTAQNQFKSTGSKAHVDLNYTSKIEDPEFTSPPLKANASPS